MDQYFGPQGPLAQRLGDAYRPRQQQQALVDLIVGLKPGTRLAVHGPVAIGKNDALGVGALLSGIPTVVSTYSLSLLDQLARAAKQWREDFPDKRIIIMRGRTHYVCEAKLAAMEQAHEAAVEFGMGSRRLPVLEWGRAQPLISGGPEGVYELRQSSCPGRTRCGHASACHYYNTRDECADADLVLTTHAQVFANVDYPSQEGQHWFTRHAWIADEGDQLLDAASDELEVSGWGMLALTQDPLTPTDVCTAVHTLVSNLHSIVGKEASATFGQDVWQKFCEKWRDRFQQCADQWPHKAFDADESKAEAGLRRLARFLTMMSGTTIRAGFAVQRTGTKDKHYQHLTDDLRRIACLKISMRYIELGDKLSAYAAHFDRFAAISGSMALPTPEGMSFDFFEQRSGIKFDQRVVLTSPIDYDSNLRVAHVPIKEKDYAKRATVFAQLCTSIAQQVGNNCLILCTSYTSIEAVEDAFAALSLPLLVQRRDSRESVAVLAQQIKDGLCASIIGNRSSWIGLDLDSRFKSTVILEKAPMPSPSLDLVLDGLLRKCGPQAWKQYGAKQAMKIGIQGAGRTLRREVDRGSLILCDARFSDEYRLAIPGGKVVDLSEAISWAKSIGTRCVTRVETASIGDDVACDMLDFLETV